MDSLYPWLKAAHIVAVVSWMSGLLYLPRLFVYHTRVASDSEAAELFKTMERKLMHAITVPAAFFTWIFGIGLIFATGFGLAEWLHVKLLLVVVMTGFNFAVERWRRDLAAGKNRHSEKFYRVMNELPALILIFIVILVVVKPF